MKGICAYFVLIIFTQTSLSQENLVVWQHPSTIGTETGASVNMYCIYSNPEHQVQNHMFYWSKENLFFTPILTMKGERVIFLSPEYHSRVQMKHEQHRLSLLIQDLTLNDSGVYFCEVVRISPAPTLTVRGNGTNITVTDPLNNGDANITVVFQLPLTFIISVTLGAVALALITLCVFCLSKRTFSKQPTNDEAKVNVLFKTCPHKRQETSKAEDVYKELLFHRSAVYDTLGSHSCQEIADKPFQ